MCLAIRYPVERGIKKDYDSITSSFIFLLLLIIIYYHYYYNYCYCCLERLEELHRNLTREQLNNLKILRDQQQQISQWWDKEITDLNQIQKAQQAMWDQWSKHFEVIINIFFTLHNNNYVMEKQKSRVL